MSRLNFVLKSRRVFQITSLAAAVAVSMASAPGARATPISYKFAPGSTVTFNGDIETLTGSFTVDTAAQVEEAVDVTLSGNQPWSETFTVPGWIAANAMVAFSSSDLFYFEVVFADNLGPTSDVSLDPTSQFVTIGEQFVGTVSGSTGPNVVVDPVPEPASLALLASALLGFGVIRRRRRMEINGRHHTERLRRDRVYLC